MQNHRMGQWQPWALALVSFSFWFTSTPATAAEKVVINYGPIAGSISVADLRQLADTGEVSPKLRSYLRVARQDPEQVRQLLNRPLQINDLNLDRMLNNPLGDLVLDQMGRVVQTPHNRADRQALRSALVLSASADGEITLIETLENYPTAEVAVDGDRLVRFYRRFNTVVGRAKEASQWLDLLTGFIGPFFGNGKNEDLDIGL